jgi:hypothetical protein
VSARSDAALSLAGGILGGLAVGTWIARRYLARPITSQPATPYRQDHGVVTSITNLKGARR